MLIMKRAWTVTVVILIVMTMFVLNYPFNISKTFSSLEISIVDNDYSINREVTFTGKYHINIFSQDEFSGSIVIPGYEQTIGAHQMRGINITQKDIGYPIIFRERDANNILHEPRHFGTIYSKRFLQSFVIIVGSSYSDRDAICIVSNVENRTDAMHHVSKILNIEK